MERRTVFFVSDQTGVTAETMGHSLLTQFEAQAFRQVTLPFISTVDKAQEAVRRINATAEAEGVTTDAIIDRLATLSLADLERLEKQILVDELADLEPGVLRKLVEERRS